MKTQATQRPWNRTGMVIHKEKGLIIAVTNAQKIGVGITEEEAEANAALILHAVTCHEELTKALKEVTSRYERLEILYAKTINTNYDYKNGSIDRAQQALLRAESI